MKSKALINVILQLDHPSLFKAQMPIEDNEIEFHFNNLDNSIIWDFVIFYGVPRRNYSFRVKNGASAFMSGEPKLMLAYSNIFLKQFKYSISPFDINKKNHFVSPPFIPWFYGFDFINNKLNLDFGNLKNMPRPKKTKIISVITSGKNFMPGHIKRLQFIEKLKQKFNEEIDFFGRDSIELNDKAEGIDDYKFHLCFENSTSSDYWTEKLSDPILGYSIPVYFGCKNIDKYFQKGIIQIDLNDFQTSFKKIENILKNHEKIYDEMLDDLIKNRTSILYELNLISYIKFFYLNNVKIQTTNDLKISIKSYDQFITNNILNIFLRVRRFAFKISTW